MKMKWWNVLGRKKPVHNKGKSYRLAGSHGSIILERLCEGEWVGGREACIATKSHNGLRRLNCVKKLLRSHGLAYWQEMRTSSAGNNYKVIQLLPSDRTRARKLIVGKGA